MLSRSPGAGFNNKPATDAIPLFVPVVSPLMQGLSPLLSGYAASPLRGAAEALSSQLRGAAPPLLRELLPLLDQMEPLTLDVAAGRCACSRKQRLFSLCTACSCNTATTLCAR